MSLCPTPVLAPVKSPLRYIFDNPAYPVPAAVRKRAEFFLFFSDAGNISGSTQRPIL